MLPLETLESRFGQMRELLALRGVLVTSDHLAELFIHTVAPGIHGRPIPVPPESPIAGRPLAAFVNDGRWLVQCDTCYSAQHASRKDHRFFCVDCLNAAVGGAWRPVQWHHQADDIDALLSARDLRKQQCWNWGQDVSELVDRNAELGRPGPT